METFHTKDQIKEFNRTSILCDKLIEINRSHRNKDLDSLITRMTFELQNELKKYQQLVGKIIEYPGSDENPPLVGGIEKILGFSASGTIITLIRYPSGEVSTTLLRYLRESAAKVSIPYEIRS